MTVLRSLFSIENVMVNVRIVFLCVSFLHLAIVAVITLNIDTTVDADPKIRAYSHIKWKLVTCWFNVLILYLYLPTRIYCEWKARSYEANKSQVELLRRITDILFTSIIVPIAVVSDIVFWVMYTLKGSLLAPVKLFEYMPLWAQHSLHTVSFIAIVIDLLIIPRTKPASLKLHTGLLLGFLTVYYYMLYYNMINGVYVYAFIETMNFIELTIATLFSMLCCLLAFKMQWHVIEARWGRRSKED